ncbi:DUF5590 domain-containing protein [Salisediminibacterium halotolerans]|uniref:Uncharacterized protein YpmB n=1 Tax=Salisediminibacterium halotolerans TaxID=517425 RepID=A0A1H9NZQ1_9BACI|nr:MULTISPECIES: DUF5590 domain-containing protein [Salisediminibacterium]RLJ77908.1 uncharacterized protein YpmB [Actinophytocola xinjiangensis]RPE88754.1 uncharacterized protein YpmB [Salisediminibacterium halotolerans]TWG36885.1 uncharacterized protein YpmB [Salisediminibacterium halotolerans]SER41297.1 Uncharacterized protein YpmB [Salisediminibacterium haloalkalitolerans]GEL07429.1 hypothetical protein SHA02_08450 [Salisediminibacterium halotolerans]
MRTWILAALLIFLLLSLSALYMLYASASSSLTEDSDVTEALALEHSSAAEILDMDYYHGTRAFHVFDAADDDGERLYVWVELEDSDEEERDENEADNNQESDDERFVAERYHDEGISKDALREEVQSELDILRLNGIRLGMIGETPVYEVNYIDASGRQSYYYVTFEDAAYIRHYQFSP